MTWGARASQEGPVKLTFDLRIADHTADNTFIGPVAGVASIVVQRSWKFARTLLENLGFLPPVPTTKSPATDSTRLVQIAVVLARTRHAFSLLELPACRADSVETFQHFTAGHWRAILPRHFVFSSPRLRGGITYLPIHVIFTCTVAECASTSAPHIIAETGSITICCFRPF